ncbi:alpha-ketoglutarate-dependent taurine dioxygenase [Rhodoferax lithotrophicus]|uniref:Alpha-ketoglutarate-dependent taurine dioxygenase n=1 Tax=Rhodoferax lithotrophicus TaxID=2798804 RepID=A0ABM7MQP4_9BURK|nr:TauD/TfdA family dioxygenase [Rhodoferax sp. MIZ03]BCO28416.1 alpha-ketoglutarate-dependent taurine dioxygenase [Rhodoferax sp. MIZ03]
MSNLTDLTTPYTHFVVQPYTPTIGGIIRGLNLSQPLNEVTQEELRQALARFEMIFFRDQTLTPEQHIAFTRIFGGVAEVKAFFPRLQAHPEIEVIESTPEKPYAANNWHADITWREQPPLGTSLYAHVIPHLGGDTIWSSQTRAYDRLSRELQVYLETLTAVHTWEISGWTEYLLARDHSGEELRAARTKYPPVEHPVVRVHPITGKKIIYVNPTFTSHIKGLPRPQSDALLGQLFDLTKVPELQVRFQWQEGSLAVWDNRSTQHYAVGDYFPQHRKLHRITITAEKTF